MADVRATHRISSDDNIIDSRDVIARINELREEKAADELFDDEALELEVLEELAAEASDYAADWQYGEVLVRDSHFEEYARELAEDIGAIDRDADWPLSYIDWSAAADALKMDYTCVEFDGIDYWIR